ncbi:MAG: hypothetical protein Ta2B_05120 [Termitinemataceae bacterium]|nr:MAG: hypothetical protein Ta2B_05120 [Termitinemataceae bacterium]
MFQLLNKNPRRRGAYSCSVIVCKYHLILFCVIVFVMYSCGFADLRPIAVTINPSESDTVLPDIKTPLSISFDTNMQMNETENLITVSYFDGNVECDTQWENGTLFLTPVAGWIPGVRYVFAANGTAISTDNREVFLSYYMPFFAVTDEPPPYLVSYKPNDSASVGVTKESGAFLQLIFSCSMERRSVEDNITISGFNDKEFTWNTDSTELVVTNKEKIAPWTIINWKLGSDVYNTNGVPIVKEEGSQFTTDIDIKVPIVESVFPMLKIKDEYGAYSWVYTGVDIETGLGALNAIGVKFSKEIDPKSITNCIRFDPAISGTIDQLSGNTIIFIPNGFPLIDTLYRLTISSEIKDIYGLKLADDYQTNFIADIPYLKIKNISFTGSSTTNLNEAQIIDGAVSPIFVSTVEKTLLCLIEFSMPIVDIQKQIGFVNDIRMEIFFPDTLHPVALTRAEWVLGGTNNTLLLEFHGIEKAAGTSYYKLYFPGGSTGLSNGKGSFLKDSVSVYLDVQL